MKLKITLLLVFALFAFSQAQGTEGDEPVVEKENAPKEELNAEDLPKEEAPAEDASEDEDAPEDEEADETDTEDDDSQKDEDTVELERRHVRRRCRRRYNRFKYTCCFGKIHRRKLFHRCCRRAYYHTHWARCCRYRVQLYTVIRCHHLNICRPIGRHLSCFFGKKCWFINTHCKRRG